MVDGSEMGFPDPSNRGVDPGDFSGRDAALGRHYYGDGSGWKDHDGKGAADRGATGDVYRLMAQRESYVPGRRAALTGRYGEDRLPPEPKQPAKTEAKPESERMKKVKRAIRNTGNAAGASAWGFLESLLNPWALLFYLFVGLVIWSLVGAS